MNDVKPIRDDELYRWDCARHDGPHGAICGMIARINADAEKIKALETALADAIAYLRQCEAGTIPFYAIAEKIKALTEGGPGIRTDTEESVALKVALRGVS